MKERHGENAIRHITKGTKTSTLEHEADPDQYTDQIEKTTEHHLAGDTPTVGNTMVPQGTIEIDH